MRLLILINVAYLKMYYEKWYMDEDESPSFCNGVLLFLHGIPYRYSVIPQYNAVNTHPRTERDMDLGGECATACVFKDLKLGSSSLARLNRPSRTTDKLKLIFCSKNFRTCGLGGPTSQDHHTTNTKNLESPESPQCGHKKMQCGKSRKPTMWKKKPTIWEV
jgi:hypothetical protein